MLRILLKSCFEGVVAVGGGGVGTTGGLQPSPSNSKAHAHGTCGDPLLMPPLPPLVKGALCVCDKLVHKGLHVAGHHRRNNSLKWP